MAPSGAVAFPAIQDLFDLLALQAILGPTQIARAMDYPIIPCDLCGSQDGLQRQQVKQILDGWERNSPGRRQVMFRALMNARPSHLLDPKLFDFVGLARNQVEIDENEMQVPTLR